MMQKTEVFDAEDEKDSDAVLGCACGEVPDRMS